ncbi:SPFH domain-containing protein [Dactylosporangium aurantiacum]|uniref:SPFH domain-containing protein n=1 Tax=Dactylosporangium aurantiacum TaxID=35754 RepID=A0A9Q9IGN7_9ACTN|nr:SPFH domain-containing protein [Dactylosporangium aurantiacum]MDG6106100.1 SPFH domain-containing protein [Dactylosporangium aurantiacum]UWZ55859.1 SPFH domain-containing protein [Dactylosporangium aurantiacum]
MERSAFRLPGFLVLLVLLALVGGVIAVVAGQPEDTAGGLVAVAVTVAVLLMTGFTVVNPNESRVVQFFGRYVGTIQTAGFHWTVPLSSKRRVSLRVRNFETARLKVSDADGNPVEIAAVVVWRVVDTFKASFGVDDHISYVAVQAEAAVRHLATSYPYEAHDDGRTSLREGTAVSEELTTELSERAALAGVEVLESRITHLAYAPEIAQAMLARQQASAIVGARFKIVEGAVGMVQSALDRLRELEVVELDEERKAQMVANLLVVLCGDRNVQPVVNTGSLYS